MCSGRSEESRAAGHHLGHARDYSSQKRAPRNDTGRGWVSAGADDYSQ